MSERRFSPEHGVSLEEAMDELVSAEDFLDFFGVPFSESVVQVNRLHIMQRYHDYLSQAGDLRSHDEAALLALHQQLLGQAYEDFVASNAQAEKVFKVFRMQEPQTTFVPIEQLLS